MSLIDEALRKARIEGAQREAERQGLPQPAPVGLPGRPRRRGSSSPPGVLLGAGLAAAAAAGLWLVVGRPSDPQGAAPVPGRAPEVRTGQPEELGREKGQGEGVAAPGAVSPGETDRGAAGAAGATGAEPRGSGLPAPGARPSAGGSTAQRPAEATPPTQPSPAPGAAAGAPREPARPAAAPADSARPTQPPASTSPAATPAGALPAPLSPPGELPVFRRTATLADGRKIVLNGIAWREDAPAAILDGQVVSPGEGVSGVTVVSIERDRVVVEAGSERFVLLLP